VRRYGTSESSETESTTEPAAAPKNPVDDKLARRTKQLEEKYENAKEANDKGRMDAISAAQKTHEERIANQSSGSNSVTPAS